MVKENATTVTLTGSEVTVEFDKNYTYFWLNNIGDSAVYTSMKPNVTADKDGVITVLSGTAAGTMHGYGADKLYLNGSGKVQIIGTYSAFCPFKVGVKGGDSGGGTSEFSAAGSATQPVYFDANGRPVAISHTVKSDVPENAVFTDTVYDDTAVKAHIADTNVHITADERTKWNAKSDFSGSYSDLSNVPTSLPANGGNADTVNGHTVKSDVPANAVFTDTITVPKKQISVGTNETVTVVPLTAHPYANSKMTLLIARSGTADSCVMSAAWHKSLTLYPVAEGISYDGFTTNASASGCEVTYTNSKNGPVTVYTYTY